MYNFRSRFDCVYAYRSILIWTASNIGDTQARKSVRVNVEYDHAIKLAWSPDSKAIIVHKYLANCIEVIKLEKKDGILTNPTKGLTFSPQHESDVIVGFGIACNGRFIMTCSNKTDLNLLDLKGRVLEKIDTCLMTNYSAKISSCGRFVAACGFSPDVKVWEVKFNKTGEYIKTVYAFYLCGHNSGIYDIAFDQDSSHMATVSKDGTWKIFNTKIEYNLGQLPCCIMTSKYNPTNIPSLIALSPNSDVVIIASGHDLEIFSALTGIRDKLIENIYVGEITALRIDPMGKYIITAGDRHVRLFHNATGYKVAIEMAKQKLKQVQQTAATRERLEQLIQENELFLKKFQ